MKRTRNILIVLWTIFAILSPTLTGGYNSDNILFAIVIEIFGLIVFGIVFGVLTFIANKISLLLPRTPTRKLLLLSKLLFVK